MKFRCITLLQIQRLVPWPGSNHHPHSAVSEEIDSTSVLGCKRFTAHVLQITHDQMYVYIRVLACCMTMPSYTHPIWQKCGSHNIIWMFHHIFLTWLLQVIIIKTSIWEAVLHTFLLLQKSKGGSSPFDYTYVLMHWWVKWTNANGNYIEK